MAQAKSAQKKSRPFIILSVVGFLLSAVWAKKQILLALVPVGTFSLLYSMPLIKIREVPYLKIFVIAGVWSLSTALLPSIFLNKFSSLLLLERFLFVFTITMPFDIRDMAVDKKYGLKTIPLLMGKKHSLNLAYFSLGLFFVASCIHYNDQPKILAAMSISAFATFLSLSLEKIKTHELYHEGILDGAMMMQAMLVCLIA